MCDLQPTTMPGAMPVGGRLFVFGRVQSDSFIQRAAHGQAAAIEDVPFGYAQDKGVDHGGFHVPSTGSGRALWPRSSWTVRMS
jgi:hypothetical protein